MEVQNKTAVVTGGAQGIGYGISLSLQNAGANVHVLDVKALEVDGIHSHICDVTDTQSITRAIQAVVSSEQSVDVLINNTGSGAGSKSVLLMSTSTVWSDETTA